jgi:poly(3-hydroxybutyrate) depolymerase
MNSAVSVETWSGCRQKTSVEWVIVAGANHAWMGHPGTPGSALLVGQPYLGFDSSAAVWSFLAAHPRPAP